MITSFVLLNKETGISSFKALYNLKKDIDTKRVGHCGTLDPFAEGLLLALTGKITKFLPYMAGMSKEYVASIRFGAETATLDTEGEIVSTTDSVPEYDQVAVAVKSFLGDIMQVPPAFSAVHIGGKRAYKLARKGKELNIPPKKVTVYESEILSYNKPDLVLRIRCSSGTYIRSIARDLAAMCGTKGYLTALRRTAIGNFSVSEVNLGSYLLITPENGMHRCGIDTVVIEPVFADMLRAGMEFTGKLCNAVAPLVPEGSMKAVFDPAGNFSAMVGREKRRFFYAFAAGVN